MREFWIVIYEDGQMFIETSLEEAELHNEMYWNYEIVHVRELTKE